MAAGPSKESAMAEKAKKAGRPSKYTAECDK